MAAQDECFACTQPPAGGEVLAETVSSPESRRLGFPIGERGAVAGVASADRMHFCGRTPDMAKTPRIRGLMRAKHDNVIAVSIDQTVHQAAEKMARYGVGCVVVEKDSGELAGILSERDVLVKVVAGGLNPRETPVSDVMTSELVHCDRDTSIAKVQQTMARHAIRHLPIIENGRAVGMISSRDILSHQMSTVEDIARIQSTVLDRLTRLFPGIGEMSDDEVDQVAHELEE
jgi:CBS domain-containing protein